MAGQGDPRVAYCSAEDVRDALDIAPTAIAARKVSRAIMGAAGFVEGELNRRFYAELDTRYFDWPINYQYAAPWRLWLDSDEVWSATSIQTGLQRNPDGTLSVTPTTQTLLLGRDFLLRPENVGPPYSHIEIIVSGHSMWSPADGTWQQAIAVNGEFGGCGDVEPAGQLKGALTSSGTSITVTDSSTVGTLDTIYVDSEWMTVASKSMTSTSQVLAADLPASAAATVLTTFGGAWTEGETLLVDGERMRVQDVAGINLVVKRAQDGTPLAAHSTGTLIWAPRQLNLTRGVLGTVPAAHASNAPVQRLAVPDLVRNLSIAKAVTNILQDSSGWTTSKGQEARVTAVRELNDLANDAYTRWARQSRTRAV